MTHTKTCLVLLCALGLSAGCSSYQPTKDVWKGTKGLWYTYASPPASIDYTETGMLPEGALKLSKAMFQIDQELERLQRTMVNADRPPTNEWIQSFLQSFPWMGGLAGVKYDGTILGQEPQTTLKELDYIPLLYEDRKQKRNALRGDVQDTPLGPEVLLAAPLYEGIDFLGVVAAHFDMRTLVESRPHAEELVILSPYALLWPGQFDFSKTPLAGQDWGKVCRESSQGTCRNSIGTFVYQVRYLGNLPLVFAVPEAGAFPKGDGSVDQGRPYFAQKREKLPPPPQPARKERADRGVPVFGGDQGGETPELTTPTDEMEPTPVHVQEEEQARMQQEQRRLEQRRERARRAQRIRQMQEMQAREMQQYAPAPRPQQPVHVTPDLDLPAQKGPTLPGGRPSPFGSVRETPAAPSAPETPAAPSGSSGTAAPAPEGRASEMLPGGRPNPFGSVKEQAPAPAAPAPKISGPETPGSGQETPSTLPGGRPNPFGS